MAFCPMKHCLAALLVLLLVCCGSTSAAATDAQVQATYNFLTKIASGIPTLAAKWTGSSYTGWEGVTVDSTTGYVTVSLASKGLSGTLTENIATEDGVVITSLDLSGNPNLAGPFDDTWAKLKLLQTLDLSNTGLYGTIPDSWNGMVNLASIKVSHVQGCGGLPNWGSEMTALTTVDLSSARLTGSLVYSWASIPNLVTVDISGNSFCGCVPTTWASKSVLSAATSGLAAAGSTCSTTNACTSASYTCYLPGITSSSSTRKPTTTTTTRKPRPSSAAFGSAALALTFCAMLASLVVLFA